MKPHDLARSVRELPTTSAKIRALAAQGHARADIARALDIRYQHVRNVLVREEAKASGDKVQATPGKVRVGADGSVVIPASTISALGLGEGDALFLRTGDGEIRLLTASAVARRVQALAREFIPENVNLVDELLDERRREVEAESQHG